MSGELAIWTIYARPRDFPIGYVVRRWVVTNDGRNVPDREARLAISLDEARAFIPRWLYRMPRQEGDDPHIVETWF